MLSPSSCHSCVWFQASPLIFTLSTWPSTLFIQGTEHLSLWHGTISDGNIFGGKNLPFAFASDYYEQTLMAYSNDEIFSECDCGFFIGHRIGCKDVNGTCTTCISSSFIQQVCIPVGCVPPAGWPYRGWGRVCLLRGSTFWEGGDSVCLIALWKDWPPLPPQVWQTNFVCGRKTQ